MRDALVDRSSKGISRPAMLVNAASGVLWLTYARALGDAYLQVPYLLGLLLAAVQAERRPMSLETCMSHCSYSSPWRRSRPAVVHLAVQAEFVDGWAACACAWPELPQVHRPSPRGWRGPRQRICSMCIVHSMSA